MLNKKINEQKLIELFNLGYSRIEICKFFNCGFTIVDRCLRKSKLNYKHAYHPKQGVEKAEELIGKKYHKLFVSKLTGKVDKRGSVLLECICDCGKIKILPRSMLGRTISCGCQIKNVGINSRKNYEDISATYWGTMIAGARTRNLEFNVTKEYVWDIYIKQNRRCALNGKPVFFIPHDPSGKYSAQTASVDRIDSTIGYVEGNIQIVYKELNLAKLNHTQEHFIELCDSVSNYNHCKDFEKQADEYFDRSNL